MLKIKIKSIYGGVLFEYEKENNTLRDTVIKAVKTGAYLRGAYLRGAYLTGADLTDADLTGAYLTGAYLTDADLTGAYLTGADLTGVDLRGADLRGAYLTGADLTGADLRGADLTGADLRGADLRGADLTGADLTGADLRGADGEKITIKKAAFFTGLYEYLTAVVIAEDGQVWIKLGCFTRKIEDWDKDFWNNNKEFPNDGSEKSNLRLFAFETAKNWIKLQS